MEKLKRIPVTLDLRLHTLERQAYMLRCDCWKDKPTTCAKTNVAIASSFHLQP